MINVQKTVVYCIFGEIIALNENQFPSEVKSTNFSSYFKIQNYLKIKRGRRSIFRFGLSLLISIMCLVVCAYKKVLAHLSCNLEARSTNWLISKISLKPRLAKNLVRKFNSSDQYPLQHKQYQKRFFHLSAGADNF